MTTAGPPAAIKLTQIVGPRGFEADGQDIALIDVEVVDGKGQRIPTDDARIDLTCTGPAIWRRGYNSGKIDSTDNLYLNTELGINRVSLRSSLSAGVVTVTASRAGLRPARIRIVSRAVEAAYGTASWIPQHLPGPVRGDAENAALFPF